MQLGDHIGTHELHGVINGHARGNRAARRVDINRNVLFRIFGRQEKELRRHQVGHMIVDRRAEEDDVVL